MLGKKISAFFAYLGRISAALTEAQVRVRQVLEIIRFMNGALPIAAKAEEDERRLIAATEAERDVRRKRVTSAPATSATTDNQQGKDTAQDESQEREARSG
jgi:hypothetical protein